MCSAHNYFDHALSADSLQTKKHILIKSVHQLMYNSCPDDMKAISASKMLKWPSKLMIALSWIPLIYGLVQLHWLAFQMNMQVQLLDIYQLARHAANAVKLFKSASTFCSTEVNLCTILFSIALLTPSKVCCVIFNCCTEFYFIAV